MPTTSFFAGAGALRSAYEQIDWAATPLGPVSSWSSSLRATLALALSTRFPVTLLWGGQFVLLYNEAYVPLIDGKHPAALGAPAADVFPEVWDTIGPLLNGVLAGGAPTWTEDARLLLRRRGFLEECFFTFSYSPVTDPDGSVAGVLDIATETTPQVVDRRRLEVLTRLGEGLRHLDDPALLRDLALPLLQQASLDLPAVDIVHPQEAAGGGLLGVAPPPHLRSGGLQLVRTERGNVVWLPLLAEIPTTDQLMLGVRLSENLAPDATYLEFLTLVAATLTSGLAQARTRAADLTAVASSRSMSEALQRSLLTEPPQPDHLQICVRYQPAAQDAQIGGDWYDAFLTGDGATCLVVGDVSGHDQQAAAGMGQVRNMLRGISYTVGEPPAAVLSALDRAMNDLAAGVLATCVLATVEQTPQDAAAGRRLLRWSNAGHPPPLLLREDGSTELLHTPPDLLLGLDRAAARSDHEHELPAGSTVLLYTDGLVERRGASLEDGLRWLADTTSRLGRLDLDALCDDLLRQVDGHTDDDVALLAVRAHPEDAPRPAQAGPQRLPQDMSRL